MLPTRRPFQIVSPFKPTGDQPTAIESLVSRISSGQQYTCLLGATGTGKTFTMAHVIERLQRPTLILSHNKTLAAQLYEEMKELFPHNAVSYFVSYYDYYQPEAYIPQRDIYIEKDASRNDDLDKLRLAATSNILSRRDTIVVASVSCIFGLGSPEAYGNKVLTITKGMSLDRRKFLLALNAMQYTRSEIEFQRAQYRVRGDVLEVFPAYDAYSIRIELFGNEVESIRLVNPTSGEELAEETQVFLFPAKHYVPSEEKMAAALANIREELAQRLDQLRNEGKLLEAQRLQARTKYDLEMLEEIGFCQGVENYSRHLDGRPAGSKPWTLMDYFDYSPATDNENSDQFWAVTRRPERDWLMIIDESHVTLPQVRAMYNGDQMRKKTLVDHGFRLPSAMDNRPLKFEEFEQVVPQVVFVSATPAKYELEKVGGEVSEQVIRPTGLLDPVITVRPADGQVADLLTRCEEVVKRGQRVLVTALTKRLCEDLTLYIHERGIKVRYLHSEIETLQRLEILTELRRGEFDVLVGVNLLREGLDLPEVSLVCILDADKEGFLRSPTSLIQTIGRAARNVDAQVIMYADKMTPAMSMAIGETERRRAKQVAYNQANNITPTTIQKAIRTGIENELKASRTARAAAFSSARDNEPTFEVAELIRILEGEMLEAAEKFEFETAAKLRDQVKSLRTGKGLPTWLKPKSADAPPDELGKPDHAPPAPGTKLRRSDLEAGAKKNRYGQSESESDRKAGMPGVRPNKKPRKKGRDLGGKAGF